MANLIKIKRSATTATPVSLAEGEVAYSENSGNFFIGTNGGLDVTKIGGNTDVTKLAGIEAGATGDQTGAEIKSLYEGEADTNAFTDAEQTKLGNISGTNTGDEPDASLTVKGIVELATVGETDTGTDDTRALTPAGLAGSALQIKVDGIEAGATADQTGAEIKSLYEGEADTNAFDDAAVSKLSGIEALADVTDATNVAAAGAVMDSDISEAEGMLRKTGAGAYEAIKTNLAGTTAPTVNEDSGDGYAVGSMWLDTTNDKAYICLDATVGAAVWKDITELESGDQVNGPASSTDEAVARFDLTTGKLLQNSVVLISDTGAISGVTDITLSGNVDGRDVSADGTALDNHIADVAGNPHQVTLEEARTESNLLSGNIDMQTFTVTGLGTPSQDSDAATKSYVDAIQSGLDIKASVRVATAAALPAYTQAGSGLGATLTANAVGVLTVDGVATVLGDRILVKDEGASHADHGIYEVTTEGTAGVAFVLTRTSDADNTPSGEVTPGMFTFIEEGSSNADSGWVLTTTGTITLDTTALAFAQFSGAGQVTAGAGLTKTGNTLDIVGTADRITVNANDINIAPTYVGQTSITTLGTIVTGTWNASVIGEVYGGTGQSTFTTGDLMYSDASDSLAKLGIGAEGKILAVSAGGVPAWEDIDGGTF